VDGNPYFMRSVFARSLAYEKAYGKKKDFSTREGLLKAYEFECSNAAGKIYDFWHWYLVRNWRAYPTFIEFGEDIYRILEFLVNRVETGVYFEDIQDFMKKKVEELIPILLHLERIDLIEWDHTSNVIFITKEPTIIASIHAIKYALFYPDDPLRKHQEENLHKHILKIMDQRLEAMRKDMAGQMEGIEADVSAVKDDVSDLQANVQKVKKNVSAVQDTVNQVHDEITSLRGSLSYAKGKKAEEAVRGMIQRRERLFSVYPVVGDVRNLNILDPASKKGYELDCVCDLDPAQLPLKDVPVVSMDYSSSLVLSNEAGSAAATSPDQKAATPPDSKAATSPDQQATTSPEKKAETSPGQKVATSLAQSSTPPVPKCKGVLVVEVKKLKEKISLAQARHFINALQALQQRYALTHIYAMFHACAGFSKTAASELMKHNIMVIEYAEEADSKGNEIQTTSPA